jgi:hypothetical protein
MLSRASSQLMRRVATRAMSSEAGAAPSAIKLNFALPHEIIYSDASVHRVIIPGVYVILFGLLFFVNESAGSQLISIYFFEI